MVLPTVKRVSISPAIADFNKAIQLDPNLAGAYNNRGVVYSETGKYKPAIADFNKAIQLDPNLADAYNKSWENLPPERRL